MSKAIAFIYNCPNILQNETIRKAITTVHALQKHDTSMILITNILLVSQNMIFANQLFHHSYVQLIVKAQKGYTIVRLRTTTLGNIDFMFAHLCLLALISFFSFSFLFLYVQSPGAEDLVHYTRNQKNREAMPHFRVSLR